MAKINVPELFGSMVFDDRVMRARLSADVYQSLRKTIDENALLELDIAQAVATEMRDWALERGATHFPHWFQPLTGVTAEKHDGFISPSPDGGVIMEFSGKELIKGEPDASSFPSGGLRATFEARGYTAWDPTSYAFIKDHTLCIPTAFCSYAGDALDKKTPLLRSMEALNRQAKRILKLFGKEVKNVRTSVGPEQEYFLIDRDLYLQRRDLVYTGRTLLGARPPKGQELDDHYFGSLKTRVAAFMRDVDEELWKLGVSAKTEHNESAPCQHELAPVFSTANIATDHNQLMMETLKRVAPRHGFACLLHEKPFAGVNGSGKHDNWGLATDTGLNLLEPGETPAENAQFLLFLCAFIRAVDLHQDLLRISVATAGNDHRLGGSEAPPAILSIYLGDDLQSILLALEEHRTYTADSKTEINIGVKTLPPIPKDTSDRNRTSPIAFTGNRFEFRMPGSSMSVADANITLNTIVADALSGFADRLEKAVDIRAAVEEIILKTIKHHKRILFTGNNYAAEWKEEAKRRGLLNLPSVPDALPYLIAEENVQLFERQQVYSREELRSRYEISLGHYCKILSIEAHTMLDIVNKEVIPAMLRYGRLLSETILAKREAMGAEPGCEKALLGRLTELTEAVYANNQRLRDSLLALEEKDGPLARARHCRDAIFENMQTLRSFVDQAEMIVDRKEWPFPGYGELLATK